MKRWMGLVAAVVLSATVASAADGAAYAKLKTLVGTWESKMPDGNVAVTDIKSISAGSALMMTQGDDRYGTMVTMIHQDGDRLMLTHYCSAKNQPRMTGQMLPDGKTIKFTFLDATNLAEGQPGHMRDLVLTLPDNDHMSQEWHFRGADGKDVVETFNLVRKK